MSTSVPDPGQSAALTSAPAIRYVALGDSYTIGTSVDETERWPNQLVARRGSADHEPALEIVGNLAVNGAASGDVVNRQLPRLDELAPDFVTLLVGVNDVVRGGPAATYERNVDVILDRLLAVLPQDRIVVVSTPDYTVTPQGAAFGDPRQQADAIRRFNAILQAAAERGRIAFVDIHEISLGAAEDDALTARDGLHPSGAQYALWVERILPTVERLLLEAT